VDAIDPLLNKAARFFAHISRQHRHGKGHLYALEYNHHSSRASKYERLAPRFDGFAKYAPSNARSDCPCQNIEVALREKK
jgi:hypothetical protein